MQSNEGNTNEPAAQYAQSVERERAARLEMESFPPGSRERAQACEQWSDAIVRTNRAWRSLRTSDAERIQQQRSAKPDRPNANA